MNHAVEISDDVYKRLERLASQQGQAPAEIVESLITHAEEASHGRPYYEFDDWMRHLGMTEEEIAAIKAAAEAEDSSDADALGGS